MPGKAAVGIASGVGGGAGGFVLGTLFGQRLAHVLFSSRFDSFAGGISIQAGGIQLGRAVSVYDWRPTGDTGGGNGGGSVYLFAYGNGVQAGILVVAVNVAGSTSPTGTFATLANTTGSSFAVSGIPGLAVVPPGQSVTVKIA